MRPLGTHLGLVEGNRALGSRGASEGGGRAREESSDGKLGHCFRSILLSINTSKLNRAAESRRENDSLARDAIFGVCLRST